MNKIKKVVASFHWSRTTYFYYKKNFVSSLATYGQFANFNSENKKTIALSATLMILNHLDRTTIKREFERSLHAKPVKSPYESEYIDAYCRLYLHIIKTDVSDAGLLATLKRIDVNERLRRLLPAPIL